eukprot:scaffold1894_cov180-Cylindrotheca_fusiformis.AAC.3
MKQIIANINYEYKDGRTSAIHLFQTVIEKLPAELLEKHTQMFFLPLVLQLVNDESNKCREALVKCLECLFRRSSTQMLQAMHGYIVKWSSLKEAGQLNVASLQVLGVFVDAQSDFLQQNHGLLVDWLEQLQCRLHQNSVEWDVLYFSLVCVEKLSNRFEKDISESKDLWEGIVECLIHNHPWVKLASGRILHRFVAANALGTVLHENPGMMFEIIRNLCFQLNAKEEDFSTDLSAFSIKTLTLLLPLMNDHPHLCYAKDVEQGNRNHPVLWLVQRLSQIAKAKGSKRRIAVFQCFAAFATRHMDIVSPYLELMLGPLHRSSVEAKNELENPATIQKNDSSNKMEEDSKENGMVSESTLAAEVLQVVEETAISSDAFLKAYANVKKKARDKKEQRKLDMKLEAANDPKAAAQRKIQKQEREKQRKKRRVQERRQERGGVKKRRSHL